METVLEFPWWASGLDFVKNFLNSLKFFQFAKIILDWKDWQKQQRQNEVFQNIKFLSWEKIWENWEFFFFTKSHPIPSLSSNKIEAIRTRALHGLGQLTKLDLSGNRISAVEAGAFEGLDSLQRIYLHSNRLTTLSARDLPVSLHGISVHENRYVIFFQ